MAPFRSPRKRLAPTALVLSLAVLAAAMPAPAAEERPARIELKAASFDPLDGPPELPPGRRLPGGGPPAGPGYYLAQLDGPLTRSRAAALSAAGAERVGFVPENTFAVRIDASRVEGLRGLAFVRWVGPFEPGYKISPDIGLRPFQDPARREEPHYRLTLDLWPGESPAAAAEAAAAAGAEILQVEPGPYPLRIKVRAAPQHLDALAAIPAVQWLEEIGEITLRNTSTPWVIQSNVQDQYTVWDRGLHGEGQVIGHIDGRIDMDSCYFRDPSNNTPGPNHRKVIAYRSNSGLGRDSHGTHTAGTAAGDRSPIDGSTFARGNAWAAKISHSNLNDITGSGGAPSNLYSRLDSAHSDGARVHTNSWGDDGTTAYTTWCRDIDQFSWDREESLVFFAVTNTSTLKTPENAKNCVGVGASSKAPNQESFCSGGRGPTNDGRRKPEVFSPGCSIISARSFSSCDTTSMTGTSMASPSTTAAAALIRQYYTEGFYPTGLKTPADAITPSAALLRATLLNGAVNMTGISAYPSDQEGWGRVLLERALHFDGDARRLAVLADVRNADGFSTGQEQTYSLQVSSSGEPLRVTLVFTEPAAALFANPATVNDLDLTVTDPVGVVYLGNDFDTTSGNSKTGGPRDPRNNVEQVQIAGPPPGTWQIRVSGTAVNQAAQGYALVAAGDVATVVGPALRHDGHQVQDSPPFGNGDGIADPGETLTLPVTLRNGGTEDALNVTAALSSDSPANVKITDASASFPNIPKGASAGSNPPHYELSLSPGLACGTSVGFSLDWLASGTEGRTGFPVGIGKDRDSYPATDVPMPVPKKTTGTVSRRNVADSFTIADATVSVTLTHGSVGEVTLRLQSPAGTTVTLHNKSRPGQANIDTTYDTLTNPDGPGRMDDFNGQNAAGDWTLTIVDDTAGPNPSGTLVAWTLHLIATGPFRCTPLVCGDAVPGAVDGSLRLSDAGGGNLHHDWDPQPGVSDYRLWRSTSPAFAGEEFVAKITAATEHTEAGALSGPATYFYQVRGLNSCNQEGP